MFTLGFSKCLSAGQGLTVISTLVRFSFFLSPAFFKLLYSHFLNKSFS